jgi:hypothetical protein
MPQATVIMSDRQKQSSFGNFWACLSRNHFRASVKNRLELEQDEILVSHLGHLDITNNLISSHTDDIRQRWIHRERIGLQGSHADHAKAGEWF